MLKIFNEINVIRCLYWDLEGALLFVKKIIIMWRNITKLSIYLCPLDRTINASYVTPCPPPPPFRRNYALRRLNKYLTHREDSLTQLYFYYHFPKRVTLRFSEQVKIFTRRFLNRYWLDLQNQWNLHINGKPTKKLTNRNHCAFGGYFLKILQNTWTVI